MMRKFLLKLSIFAVYAVLLSVIIPVWVDPFHIFHWNNIRADRPILPILNNNYVKMNYIVHNSESFDSLLFGSSRVGAIHTDKIIDEKCYNMMYTMGLPGWHLLNIKTLCNNSVLPKKIYIGLDSISYTGDYAAQINDPVVCPYEYLQNNPVHFVKLYFDTGAIARSLAPIRRAWLRKSETVNTEVLYKYGWHIQYERDSDFDWNDIRKVVPIYGNKTDIDGTLDIVRETTDICRENGIELILFTNPMHRVTYLASVRDKEYLRFLEGLAEIAPFWNFSSLSDITVNNDNYLETSHYRAKVGDIMIDIMCNGKSYPELQRQGFGVRVTRENAKDFIDMLRRQYEDYEKSRQ